MTSTLLVQSQDELDKALADGVADLRIEHPLGSYLTIADDPGFWLTLWGNSRAELWGNSRAELWGNSRAELWGTSSAVLREDASASLRENSRAELWGTSRAELWGTSSVVLWGTSSAVLSRFTVAWLRSPLAKATGTGHIIDMTAVDLIDPALWADFHGVKVVDGIATVYKALKDHYGTDRPGWEGKYAPGETPEAPDWRDDASCGGGLHFSPTPHQASEYLKDATRWVKVGIDLATLRPILGSGAPKCKAPKVVVPCVEVDINGEPVEVEQGAV